MHVLVLTIEWPYYVHGINTIIQLKLFDCYDSAVDKSDNNRGTASFRAHRELPIVWDLRDGRRFVPCFSGILFRKPAKCDNRQWQKYVRLSDRRSATNLRGRFRMVSNNPIVYHCIIHRQALYWIFSLKKNECTDTVMLTVDHSRPKGFIIIIIIIIISNLSNDRS